MMTSSRFYKSEGLSLCVVAIVSALVLYIFRSESQLLDDSVYFQNAYKIVEGYRGALGGSLNRFTYLLNITFFQYFLGYTAKAYYTFTILHGVALVMTLYSFLTLYFSKKFTIATVVAFLFSPIYLPEATLAIIDWPILVWYMLAVLFLAKSTVTPVPRLKWVLVSGLCLGVAVSLKESTVIYSLALVSFFSFNLAKENFKRCIRNLFLFFLTAGITFAILEVISNYIISGSIGTRILSVLHSQSRASKALMIDRGFSEATLQWVQLFIRYPLYFFKESIVSFLWIFLGSIGGLLALRSSNEGAKKIALVAFINWILVSGLIVSSNPLIPLLRTKGRYFSVVSIFLFPLAIFLIQSALKKYKSKWQKYGEKLKIDITLIPLVSYILVMVFLHLKNGHFVVNGNGPYSQAGAVITREFSGCEREGKIYTDLRTLRILPLYLSKKCRSHYKSIEISSNISIRSQSKFKEGDIIIVNKKRLLNNQKYYYNKKVPNFYFNPPSNWHLKLKTSWQGLSVYRVLSN